MKSLYLVEGDHDYKFINGNLILNYKIKSDKINFYSNEGFKAEKRMAESALIRNLNNEYYGHDILIKSEIGKKSLVSLLGKVCIPTIERHWQLKLTTILDHDGKNPLSEFKDIFDKVRKTHPQVEFNQISDTPYSDIGHTTSYSVLKVGGRKRTEVNKIHFFCFYTSLEKVIESKFGNGVDIEKGIEMLTDEMKGINFLP